MVTNDLVKSKKTTAYKLWLELKKPTEKKNVKKALKKARRKGKEKSRASGQF